MAIAYHSCMPTDNPRPIKGDVIPESVRRVSGRRGSKDGLIEVGLVGHPFLYRARVDITGPAPRLTELHLVAVGDAEVDPAAIRQVPVRRIAQAVARFVTHHDGAFTTPDEIEEPTKVLRPDEADGRGRRKLDDTYYRQVAELLVKARERGFPPRDYVARRLRTPKPTLDRHITEAKRREFLPRDWATTTTASATTEENER